MRRILTVTALITVLSASACGSDPSAAPAAPSAQPAPTNTAPSSSAPDDPQGELACRLNKEAAADGPDALKDNLTMTAIVDAAAGSPNARIKDQVAVLEGRFHDALAAEGTDDELAAGANLLTASVNMGTVCIESGLDKD